MYRQPELNGMTPEEVLDYLRKSQSDDPLLTVEEVLSKHETMLDEWAEKHLGGIVPEENKFREVVSGESLKNRPEIQKVLKLIESPKIKAVKVVEPQRLTRGDLEDIGRLMKLLKHTNTLVITLTRVYDLRDEYDWDAFERELKRGNEYLQYTKKILGRGRLLSVSQGNFISPVAPYGYERATVMDGKRKCPTLKIKEDEANVVRMIFDMYANQNMGRIRIADHLDNLGIKPPRGDHWTASGIRGILTNPHYIGKVRWNFRKTVTVVEDSEFIKTRPQSSVDECLIFEGKHDPIVDEEIYNDVQKMIGNNPRHRKSKELVNPFAGLAYCQCGRAMFLQRYFKDGKEIAAPRFCCTKQSRCGTASCHYEDFFNEVCSVLEQCIEDFEIRIQNDDGDSRKLHLKLVQQLESKMKELEEKEISQWEKYSEEGMPKHIFDKLNEKVLKEKEEVKQALCNAKNSTPDPVDYEEKLHHFQDVLEALKNPDVSVPLKNKLLKTCFDRIIYNREKPKRIHPDKITRGEGGRITGGSIWTSPPLELDVKLMI